MHECTLFCYVYSYDKLYIVANPSAQYIVHTHYPRREELSLSDFVELDFVLPLSQQEQEQQEQEPSPKFFEKNSTRGY